jgi:hypothetical protein
MSGGWVLASTGCFMIRTFVFIFFSLCWAGSFMRLAPICREVSKMQQAPPSRFPMLAGLGWGFPTVENAVENAGVTKLV